MGGINHQYIALPTTLVGMTVYDHLWTGNFLSQPAQTDIGFGTLFIQRCILIPGVYIWLGIWSHNPTCNQRLVLGWMKIITEVGSSWCYLMGRKSDTCWHVVLWRPRNRIFFRCVVPYVFSPNNSILLVKSMGERKQLYRKPWFKIPSGFRCFFKYSLQHPSTVGWGESSQVKHPARPGGCLGLCSGNWSCEAERFDATQPVVGKPGINLLPFGIANIPPINMIKHGDDWRMV